MSDLVAARLQMGTSLAFHIIFASLGIGLPLLLLITEGLYLRTKDQIYQSLAIKWGKATAILFAIGAVSGTALSFELGLLWPGFMEYAGSIIGMPFSLEGFAFFTEAIFLGLYLYGRQRLSPLIHWLTTFPIALSGALSAAFVISANAWMNSPGEFELVNNQPTNVNPLAAMFNPAWGIETLHATLAAYVATGFGLAAVYAFGLLRGKLDSYHRKGLGIGLALGCISIPLQLLSGDLSARWVAENQPPKLAAMEGLFHTESCAPLSIGGIANLAHQSLDYAIQIPCGLSILTSYNANTTITGLDAVPSDQRPNPAIVHPSFDLMVGIGIFLGLLALWTAFLWWKKRNKLSNKWLLRSVVLAGPLGFMAIELGWTVTEEGRQPWVAYGLLRTSDAVTTAPGVGIMFGGFSVVYIGLSVITVWLLLRLARTYPGSEPANPTTPDSRKTFNQNKVKNINEQEGKNNKRDTRTI